MEAKDELLKLSKVILNFDEVKAFDGYIKKMAKFRSDNESEEYSNIKHAFICIAGENKHLMEKENSRLRLEADKTIEIFDEILKIKKFIKKLRIF